MNIMLTAMTSTNKRKARKKKSMAVSATVREKMLMISEKSGLCQHEIARIFAYLESINADIAKISSEFWNIRYSAAGILKSSATLEDGTPIWRLIPPMSRHAALLAEFDGVVAVLDVCRTTEIESAERQLIAEHTYRSTIAS
jgi:hypothetical protein